MYIKILNLESESMEIQRGTRHRDILSLLAISIEPLAEMIRSNPQIQGTDDQKGLLHARFHYSQMTSYSISQTP